MRGRLLSEIGPRRTIARHRCHMIPVAKSIEVTARGSAYKSVVCEECQCEYVYLVTRDALGSVSGFVLADKQAMQERATRFANASLRSMLARAEEPVPCPNCGHYQQSMIPLLQRKHRPGLFFTGLFFLVVGGSFWFLALVALLTGSPRNNISPRPFVEAAVWITTFGFGLIVARRILSLGIRPNDSNPEERKLLARSLAMTKREFELQNPPAQASQDNKNS